MSNPIQVLSFQFALKIIQLYQKLVENKEYVLSKQLLRSGTSIGANIAEAAAAISKKDFILKMSIASKEASIKHIDDILTSVSQRTNSGSLVAYNDNTDLSELVKNKNKLVAELAQNKIDRINYDDVVKEGSSMLNIKDPGITSGRMKYIYPILFILLFMLGVRFVKFYKKQVEKRKKVVVNE